MEEEESSVQSLLEKLQADLVLKFEELRVDNQSMKERLRNIESKLGLEIQGERRGEKKKEEEEEESQREENMETTIKEVEQAEPVLDPNRCDQHCLLLGETSKPKKAIAG